MMRLFVDGRAFKKNTHGAELLVALFQKLFDRFRGQLAQRGAKVAFQAVGHQRMIAMGAAERLGDHRVNQSQAAEVLRGHLERLGRLFLEGVAFPKDAGAALGADDRIVSVFEHGDAVADADSQGAARAALADHDADDRRAEPRHFQHRLGDDLGLAAFLGADAGIRAAGVDQANDGHVELGRQMHGSHRLAIALGVGVAVVAEVPFLERLAFLVSDDENLVGVEFCPARANRPIVAEGLVAMQLDELLENQFEVVGRHGAIGVPRDLDGFPRLQVGVDSPFRVGQFAAKEPDFVANLRRALGFGFELFEPGFQFVDGAFKRESVFASCHVRAAGLWAASSSFFGFAGRGFRQNDAAVRPKNPHHTKFPKKSIHRFGACGGIFREASANQLGKIRRNVGVKRLQRGGRRPQMLRQQVVCTRPCEWWPARQYLVDRAGEAIEVGTAIERRPANLLGRDVAFRALDLRSPGEPLAQPSPAALRQGEIDQLYLAVVGHEEVVRLDVAVDPTGLVDVT